MSRLILQVCTAVLALVPIATGVVSPPNRERPA